ncbi:dnaJ [Symbiodinium sp. CCMP2456]|nr:dnaJ [Symbiodinium sp. CCMP2456]
MTAPTLRRALPDYYAALEIHEDADEATIKKAYRRLVLQWHPDRNPADRETAEEKIRLLNTAYEIVTNPIKRETYDLQRAASSRKRKAPAKPRSAPRVEIPKEFMMQPVGHPESFIRGLGRRVVVHSRGDAPDADFKTFFTGTKLALWWLPEVNNMCRIRGLGSKARGDKRGAAAGRAGGLNIAFDPQKAKTAGAAGSEVRLAPANKGQKVDSVNFVTKASPICEGALRFETASQRGHYLAYFPPTFLRVVPFLEEAEDRVLDFIFVDFQSMFKFINLDEVLEPVFSAEEPGAWIDLSKLQEDEAVKSHFKEVMGKPVWDAEDFQAYFEGHWSTFEYKPQEKLVRLRPWHSRASGHHSLEVLHSQTFLAELRDLTFRPPNRAGLQAAGINCVAYDS